MPNTSQFSIDRFNPGLWTITFSNPPINIFVPETIVELGALMTDLEADKSVKVVVFQSANPEAQINRFGTPTATELQSSNDLIFPLLALPDAQARRPRLRGIGYGVPSDFELNFGRYLPGFGRADDDDADKQPG